MNRDRILSILRYSQSIAKEIFYDFRYEFIKKTNGNNRQFLNHYEMSKTFTSSRVFQLRD